MRDLIFKLLEKGIPCSCFIIAQRSCCVRAMARRSAKGTICFPTWHCAVHVSHAKKAFPTGLMRSFERPSCDGCSLGVATHPGAQPIHLGRLKLRGVFSEAGERL